MCHRDPPLRKSPLRVTWESAGWRIGEEQIQRPLEGGGMVALVARAWSTVSKKRCPPGERLEEGQRAEASPGRALQSVTRYQSFF